jgi:hypothetical protein
MPDPVRSPHSRVAALKRHGNASPAEIAKAERELREAVAVAQIRRMVAGLSPEERARLAVAALTPAGDA